MILPQVHYTETILLIVNISKSLTIKSNENQLVLSVNLLLLPILIHNEKFSSLTKVCNRYIL